MQLSEKQLLREALAKLLAVLIIPVSILGFLEQSNIDGNQIKNNMPSLRQMVSDRINRNVYPNENNPYVGSQPVNPGKQSNQNSDVRIGARITGYNWTGNKMANGKYPKPGYVASSNRKIPLGTKVSIDGKVYEVGDRTANWIHTKHGDTFDIYYDEPESETIKRGAPRKNVQILD